MDPTKFIFAKEFQPGNASVIWNLRLLAPNEHRTILTAFASTSFDGLKLDFQGDANHNTDHWLVKVPGGLQVNAELLAEEIEQHLRKMIDPELDFKTEKQNS